MMEKTQLPFWIETLRLLYWVFFKPFTLQAYVNSLEPELPKDYSLWQARKSWRKNQPLKRLVWQAFLLITLLPLPVEFLVTCIFLIMDYEVNWLGIARGVAMGVALGIAAGVMLGIARGMAFGVAVGVAYGLVLGVSFGLVSGVGFGLVLGVGLGMGLGVLFRGTGGLLLRVEGSVTGSVVSGKVFVVLFGLAWGVAMGVAGGVGWIISYFRLFFFPFQWVLLRVLLLTSPKPEIVLKLCPHRWDQVIWFPLWGLDRLALQVARQDLDSGLVLAESMIQSLAQKKLGRKALANITAYVLAQSENLEALAQTNETITWLPNDLSTIRPDLAEIYAGISGTYPSIPSLEEVDKDILGYRLELRSNLQNLDALQNRLGYLGREAEQRWSPVLSNIHTLLVSELEKTKIDSGTTRVENPYQVGTPLHLTRKNLFRGRQQLRDEILQALRRRDRPTLVLSGPRRMGKTSFLLQLPALLPGDTIPVFIDLQRPSTTNSDGAFLYTLARAIERDARPYKRVFKTPNRSRFLDNPFEAFSAWQDTNLDPALREFKVLLCLDEFEKVGMAMAEGHLSSRVFDELRHIIQHQSRLAMLFAGVQTLEELGPKWSSYFINVRAMSIGYLDTDETEDLICNPDPEVESFLTYDDEAVGKMITDTHCHPYLVQLVCSCIVEQANQREVKHVDLELVEAGEQLALERGEPYFRNVWDEMAAEDGQAMLRDIALAETPVQLEPSEHSARQALQRMVRLKVLTQSDQGYSVEVPIVRRWIVERAPV